MCVIRRRGYPSFIVSLAFVLVCTLLALCANPTPVISQPLSTREPSGRASHTRAEVQPLAYEPNQRRSVPSPQSPLQPTSGAAFVREVRFIPHASPTAHVGETVAIQSAPPHSNMRQASLWRVEPGDCLWNIALAKHTTVSAIVQENHLTSTILHIGQVLRVIDGLVTPRIQRPKSSKANSSPTKSWHPMTYVVQPGDSLWKISREFGVSIRAIINDNALLGDDIQPGQRLVIGPMNASYHPTAASRALIASAPKWLIPIYQAAGRKYDIPWTVLAAIHKEETDFDTTGDDVSSAGALGPMQFMPSTFAIFGVPAPGHKTPSIYNVEDAIYSAANMLHQEGFSQDPYYAVYAYNHSTVYVHDILHMSAT
ncbi:LysM peptidoglycan-binding domain-containing protein [Alicyclobacillus hesperidum]|uniref:LysM peptidoglycan-binding domain-containing protein n=1 Tax=Alicyclobacillus hesperidum TaxID=89784 RepID=UPI0024E15EDE|nr:LysM peptidoglycan-binding domain-containing protein [Alicyclobacillus hesperidum]